MTTLALESYDRGVNRDPRNLVGKQVAREIHNRTGLPGDFTFGMNGCTAFRIANEVHNLVGAADRIHCVFAAAWKV